MELLKSAVQPMNHTLYPERDGKPIGETQTHIRWLMWLIAMLEDFFAGQPVFMAGNLLVYYEEGNPRRFVVPDVFVVRNHPPGERRVYKVWEERRVPDIVFEITSRGTRQEDTDKKMVLYAQLGVQEYFLYDPLAEYLNPPLRGYQLVDDQYHQILPNQLGGLGSDVLGLTLKLEKTDLQLYLPTGIRLLTRLERLEQENHRIAELEAELRALRQQLKRD